MSNTRGRLRGQTAMIICWDDFAFIHSPDPEGALPIYAEDPNGEEQMSSPNIILVNKHDLKDLQEWIEGEVV